MERLIEVINNFKDGCKSDMECTLRKNNLEKISTGKSKIQILHHEAAHYKTLMEDKNVDIDDYIDYSRKLTKIEDEVKACQRYLMKYCKLLILGTKEYDEYVSELKKNSDKL